MATPTNPNPTTKSPPTTRFTTTSSSTKASTTKSKTTTERPMSYIPSFSNGVEVTKFLSKRKAVSHTSHNWSMRTTIVPLAYYMLNRDEDETDFFRAYNDDREQMGDKFMSGLQENTQDEWPVIVRVHYPGYTGEQVTQAAAEVQNVMTELLNPESCDNKLHCFVLEYNWPEETEYRARNRMAIVMPEVVHSRGAAKRSPVPERPVEEQLLRDTFILHFPYIFMSTQEIELTLYPYIHDRLQELFRYHTRSRCVVTDTDLMTKPYTLFGSKENENVQPMRLTRVINPEQFNVSLTEALNGYHIYRSQKVLIGTTASSAVPPPPESPTPGTYTNQWIEKTLSPATDAEAQTYLPEVLSIHRRHRPLFKVDHDRAPSNINALSREWVTSQAMRRWYRAHKAAESMGMKRSAIKVGMRVNMQAPTPPEPDHLQPATKRLIEEWQSKTKQEINEVENNLCCSREQPAGLLYMLRRKKRVHTETNWRYVLSIIFDLYGGSDLGLTRLIQFTVGNPRKTGGGGGGRARLSPFESSDVTDEDYLHNTNTSTTTLGHIEEDEEDDDQYEFEPKPVSLETDDEDDEKNPHSQTNRRRRALRSRQTTAPMRAPPLTPELKCIWAWHRHQPTRRHTILSLELLCREDDSAEYRKLQESRLDIRIKKVLNDGIRADTSVAGLVAHLLRDEYVCVSTSHMGNWYQFSDHRWHYQPGGAHFENAMQKALEDLCFSMMLRWQKQLGDMEDRHGQQATARRGIQTNAVDDDFQAYEDQGDRINRLKLHMNALRMLAGKVKESNFLGGIVRVCRRLMFDDSFASKLDSNPKLIGFANGVFDLSMGRHGKFRAGEPSDYVTKTCGYEFPVHIKSDTDEEVMLVKNHFGQVFPNKSVREFVLEFCGSLLAGGNPDKVVLIFNGGGHNGKSVTNNLLMEALGDYATTLPCSVLTGKRAESNAATPEMAKLPGVRYVIFNEPEKDEYINAGKCKEYSGNDRMYARALFSVPFDFYPMFKMCITCNDTPKFSTDDPAIWARVRKVLFESLFDSSPEIVNKSFEQQWRDKTFPRDPHFNDKLKQMAPAMMWLMVAYYGKITTLGRDPEPMEVIQATQQYRIQNDPVDQFLRSCVTTTKRRQAKDKAGNMIAGADGNDGSYMDEQSSEYQRLMRDGRLNMETTATNLFEAFKRWYVAQGLGKRTPQRVEVIQSLSKFYGEVQRMPGTRVEYWPGVYLKLDVEGGGVGAGGAKVGGTEVLATMAGGGE